MRRVNARNIPPLPTPTIAQFKIWKITRMFTMNVHHKEKTCQKVKPKKGLPIWVKVMESSSKEA